VERAITKAARKGVDLLVYNNVAEEGSGFGADTNRVVFIDRAGGTESLEQMSKPNVAIHLWDRIEDLVSLGR
jgi:phosphopantothenoylcysteine decarboxylase/phosphopantothenate--cysteine ligase